MNFVCSFLKVSLFASLQTKRYNKTRNWKKPVKPGNKAKGKGKAQTQTQNEETPPPYLLKTYKKRVHKEGTSVTFQEWRINKKTEKVKQHKPCKIYLGQNWSAKSLVGVRMIN